MKKRKKLMIILAVIFIGAVAFLYFEQQATNRRIIEIPKQRTVSSVKFSKNYTGQSKEVNDKNSIAEIYSALLQAKKCLTKESVQDVPQNVVGDVTLISIEAESNEMLIFAYKATDGKYYLEVPYVHIYEITEQYYNVLIKYSQL